MSTDNLTHSRLYHVPGSSIEALQALIYLILQKPMWEVLLLHFTDEELWSREVTCKQVTFPMLCC